MTIWFICILYDLSCWRCALPNRWAKNQLAIWPHGKHHSTKGNHQIPSHDDTTHNMRGWSRKINNPPPAVMYTYSPIWLIVCITTTHPKLSLETAKRLCFILSAKMSSAAQLQRHKRYDVKMVAKSFRFSASWLTNTLVKTNTQYICHRLRMTTN